MELNGLKITLNSEVSKETINIGKNVNDDLNDNGKKEIKKPNDKYVKTNLIIKNDNSYEKAYITIEEIAPTGFRQIDSSKNERIINITLEPKSDIRYEYIYRYNESFLKDQNNSILYDEDGNIIESVNDVKYEDKNDNKSITNENKKNKISKKSKKGNLEEESEDLKKGALEIVKFLIAFVVCIVLLIVFIMFYKTIKGNDSDFFNNNDSFKCFIIILLISVVINIFNSRSILANNRYEPQIYEYGKSYEKVIYEPVYFNEGLYKFAYKITFSYDSNYIITDEDYEKDTDGDGLIDAFEYLYMTDKENVDTDGDDLSDYIEVMYLDYNPLSNDTFKDGINDGDRDYDNDKLTNIEEVKYGTELYNVDTDYDTLNDYEEINLHHTNPLSIDTDEDYLSDPDELKLGLDPTNKRTDGVTLDSERKIEQEYNMTKVPSELREGDIFIKNISGSVSGNIDNEVKISKKNEEVFNSMNSFVQSGFQVTLKEDEKIDIELDVSKVSDRKTVLIVVRYEDGMIEAIDTVCEENSIKANIGNGTYSVMDSEIVLKDLNIMVSDYMP